jgi:photosystem II stability/assembly factor-like uncharacterized protein
MPEKIFISNIRNGIARASQDLTGHWSVTTLLANSSISCLASDPASIGVVYAGTINSGVLRSSDFGQIWKPAGLEGLAIRALCASHTDPGTVYAGTKPPALFVTHNSGVSWHEIVAFRKKRSFWWFSPAEGRPFIPYVQAIALSPVDPELVTAGIELGAVLTTTNGGKTWEGHRPGALRDCHSLIGHAVNGDWFYEGGGSGNGAAFSKDGGMTWRQPSGGLDRHYGWAVAADPARPEIWYAALSASAWKAHSENDAQACIFRSAGGAVWEKLNGGLPQPLNSMPYALLTDPHQPGHIYTGLGDGSVWFSPDYGEAWEQMPFTFSAIQRSMIILYG